MAAMTPRILDCTIRDGSYVVDFQFTAEDTAVIAAGLENAGVEWIEIGHGLGLNASAAGKGAAAASDEAYLRAAQETLRHAMWGMFFIPGIGRREDLDLAASHGMRFVRIGANAPDIAQTEPFVRQALALGLHVSVNLMKSYAVPPERLVELSKMAEGYGAHVVSLVDSAGTMLPDDVRGYVSRMKDGLRVDIGFHGHDNLTQYDRDRVFLKCISCGHESPGWELTEAPPTVRMLGDAQRHVLTPPQLVQARRVA